LRKLPSMTRFAAYIMCRDCILSDEKTRESMGYRPVITIEEGLQALSGAR
jgi:nucleoside-diphosphate-sugar epimerase